MEAHELNVRLARWSVASGLPLLPAALPAALPARPPVGRPGEPRHAGGSLRETLAQWAVTRRARTRTTT